MYAAWQAGVKPIAPYVEADVSEEGLPHKDVRITPASAVKKIRALQSEKWVRVTDDMGFPAGLPKTITVDLSGKFPLGTQRIRIRTNLEIYWDNILIDRSEQQGNYQLTSIPLTKATLENHGYPLQI